jgi:hypothetical protein
MMEVKLRLRPIATEAEALPPDPATAFKLPSPISNQLKSLSVSRAESGADEVSVKLPEKNPEMLFVVLQSP